MSDQELIDYIIKLIETTKNDKASQEISAGIELSIEQAEQLLGIIAHYKFETKHYKNKYKMIKKINNMNTYYITGKTLINNRWHSCSTNIKANSFEECARELENDNTFKIKSIELVRRGGAK